jgi:predicted esterase
MKPRYILTWCALAETLFVPKSSQSQELTTVRRDVQFSQSAPYASDAEITRRLGYRVAFPGYHVTNETFRIIAPQTYPTNVLWGLFVWISPNDDPGLPSDWERELANDHLVVASACRSGNQRHPLDRFRLALDATCNSCRQFKIDRQRIYVSGFSGGARIASMLGVGYADLFTGTLCVCGVNFYKGVPTLEQKYFPATYVPDPGVLLLAKRNGHFVLLTGETDPNRQITKDTMENGFKPNGFKNVLYVEVPGMSHAIPDATMLHRALVFLSGTNLPSPVPSVYR